MGSYAGNEVTKVVHEIIGSARSTLDGLGITDPDQRRRLIAAALVTANQEASRAAFRHNAKSDDRSAKILEQWRALERSRDARAGESRAQAEERNYPRREAEALERIAASLELIASKMMDGFDADRE